MKKNIFALLTVAIMAMLPVACSGEIIVQKDSPLPWSRGAAHENEYEYSVYDITKTDDIRNVTVATGEMTIELKYDHEESRDNTTYYYSKLTIGATMVYTDDAADYDKGKTDSVFSEVIFNSESLQPKSSTKTVALDDRADPATGVAYTNCSYTFIADYDKGESHLTFPKCEQLTAENIGFSGNNLMGVYDNEMLFYAVRAFKDVRDGGSTAFKMTDFFDIHNRGGYFTYAMNVACSSATTDSLPQFAGKFAEDGSLSVIDASVTIGGDDPPGPEITLRYALTPFTDNGFTAQKVLVSVKSYVYDYTASKVRYTTHSRLKEFSFTPPAE